MTTTGTTGGTTVGPGTGVWTGEWVAEHAGVELRTRAGSAPLAEICGLALRRNPKRFHLVVSTVLAKHVPVPPSTARSAGSALGDLVEQHLGGERVPLVVGYAETATGLGHLVADRLGATALHSTRRPGWSALSFEEEHSHATTHRLQPSDAELLTAPGPLVLVDDELTTGRTILNTIRELQALAPRRRYVAAALVDLRGDEARATADTVAAELGVEIGFVSLRQGEVRYVREPAPMVLEAVAGADAAPAAGDDRATESWATTRWPAGVPDGGRHGLGPADADGFEAGVAALAEEVGDLVAGAASVHVLGTEELVYLPLRLGEALEEARPATSVTVSSTTRSPVVVRDEPGYAVRHGLVFAAHDGADAGDGDPPRFAYNLAPDRFDAVVLVLDAATPVDGAAPLRAALRRLCDTLVVVRVAE